jgi:hypothetical protein
MKAMQIVQPRVFDVVEVPVPSLKSGQAEHRNSGD